MCCLWQELIDRLAADNAISEQDCQWLMYGACSSAEDTSQSSDPLAREIDDLSQQVSRSIMPAYQGACSQGQVASNFLTEGEHNL